jgi:hypothetical protein
LSLLWLATAGNSKTGGHNDNKDNINIASSKAAKQDRMLYKFYYINSLVLK